MKKQARYLTPLLTTFLLLLISGCAITIHHTFDEPPVVINNYHQNGGVPTSLNPTPIAENNTLSTADLGVGYDIVKTDPEYWSQNSVGDGRGVRPKVFEFLPDPDPNATIDVPRLTSTSLRRRKPLGVDAETNNEFRWDENMDFVSSATEFQASHTNAVSAGGGALGIAFSASASFGNTQDKTTSQGKTLATKEGVFSALKMEIDFSAPQRFTPEFTEAVAALTLAPADYDNFIKRWGTHFSKVATIGAKCAYQLEFNRSEVGDRYQSETSFEGKVGGSMGGISAEVGAEHAESEINGKKNEIGAEKITFVSYGASGVGINDYAKWTEHAVNNTTMIDAYLVSYDVLFSKKFFPNDADISRKAKLFSEACKRYYAIEQARINALPKAGAIEFGQTKPPQTFSINLKYLQVVRGKNDEIRNYGGIMHFGVYDKLNNEIQKKFVENLNGRHPHYLLLQEGATNGKKNYNRNITLTLTQQQLEGAFVTITGNMTQTSKWGFDEYVNSMGNKIASEQQASRGKEVIFLNALKVNIPVEGIVTYTMQEPGKGNDIVKIFFEVKRTR